MAIEGPLRELGIHDVFQLLDLSRKTGMLRVSSELREDEGVVLFDGGRVVQASIRSKSIATELALLQAGRITESDLAQARGRHSNGHASTDIVDLLVDSGAITQTELERQLRLQIESVVFELMSWREGFFSFEERPREELPGDTPHHRVHRIAAHGRRAPHRRVVAHRRHRSEPRRGAGARAGGCRPRRRDARSAAARVAGADDDRRGRAICAPSPRRSAATSSRSPRSRMDWRRPE